jgi:hypothetical protein
MACTDFSSPFGTLMEHVFPYEHDKALSLLSGVQHALGLSPPIHEKKDGYALVENLYKRYEGKSRREWCGRGLELASY